MVTTVAVVVEQVAAAAVVIVAGLVVVVVVFPLDLPPSGHLTRCFNTSSDALGLCKIPS